MPDRDALSRRWSTATLRIWSATMPPEQIAMSIGLEPSKAYRRGDQRGSRVDIRCREHVFLWKPDVARSEPLATHLDAICDRIEPIAPLIGSLPDCMADVFCGYSSDSGQGGTTLPPALLMRLARQKLPVVLDLYPPPRDG